MGVIYIKKRKIYGDDIMWKSYDDIYEISTGGKIRNKKSPFFQAEERTFSYNFSISFFTFSFSSSLVPSALRM